MTPKIKWIDNMDQSKLTTMYIPTYDDIDFVKREREKNMKPKKNFTSILKVKSKINQYLLKG